VAQPPSTMEQDTEYPTLDLHFAGRVCFDKQAQISESGFTGQSQYER